MDGDDDKLLGNGTTSAPAQWRFPRAVVWCLLAHSVLIILHGVLWLAMVKDWDHRIPVSEHLKSQHLQTMLTLITSIFGTLYLGLLLMMTQRIALRHVVLQRQNLTTLHDRTATWLGLGATVNTMWKQRGLSRSIALTLIYLSLLFGLHNTTPALLNVISLDRFDAVPAIIAQVTPISTSLDKKFEVPYQDLPAMLNFADLRGARGPMLYDTFQSGTVGSFSNWTGPVDGMSAQVCATTFRSTCKAMTASNVVAVSSTAGASAWNITLDDGWVTRIDQSAGEILSNNGSPMLVPMVRVIPAPGSKTNATQSMVDYVTVLALWNVTDASGVVHNTVHISNVTAGSNVTNLDMTFLRCSLAWDVSGAVYGASGSLQVSSDVGSCQRVDSMPANRTTDPVHYNWTSIWTDTISRPPSSISGHGFSAVNGTPNVLEDYLMSILGWYVPDSDWDEALEQYGFWQLKSLPTADDMARGLANMTALLFWFGATTDTAGSSWPLPYRIVAQQAISLPHVNVRISWAAVTAGLVLSILITLVVLILFWGRELHIEGIGDAGVLELAWLLAREQSEFQPLLDVNVPTEEDLRKVGRRIAWRASVPEE